MAAHSVKCESMTTTTTPLVKLRTFSFVTQKHLRYLDDELALGQLLSGIVIPQRVQKVGATRRVPDERSGGDTCTWT